MIISVERDVDIKLVCTHEDCSSHFVCAIIAAMHHIEVILSLLLIDDVMLYNIIDQQCELCAFCM